MHEIVKHFSFYELAYQMGGTKGHWVSLLVTLVSQGVLMGILQREEGMFLGFI